MAKQTQRPAPKSKPITSNPLFPAVVALWFGALFGLSSIAVRVSVIETLVMKSGIDLIVPAAAPPLGITARILVALIMAALGAVAGSLIGRRLARPKTQARERKRSAKAGASDQPRLRARDSHPDAPVRKPISAHEEFAEVPVRVEAPAAPGLLANRRRGLTAEQEPQAFVPQELAPLPGGEPHILDLAGAEIEPQPPGAALTVEPPATDLNAFASDDSAPAAAPETVAHDLSFDDGSCDRQNFHASAPTAEPEAGGAPVPGRQIFGLAPVEPQHPDDRQVFGSSAADGAAALDIDAAANRQVSAFDTPSPASLFAERAAPAATVHDSFAAPTSDPLPSIADLGMTDLAVRLQESMKRRRAARAAASLARLPVETLAEVANGGAADPVAASEPLPARPDPVQPPAVTELPAALRPLALDAFADEDEDDDTLASLLPPRHIAMPPVALPPATPLFAPTAAAAEDDAADEPDGDYASLLNVAPVAGRPSFVRIEELHSDSDAIEPVVIFPGQGPRVPLGSMTGDAAHDVAPVVSPTEADPAPFRRFDAPASAGQGQPIAAAAVASALDPDEAERSMRSALANLQRISGAA